MAKTDIEWAEYTVNPFVGCSPVSEGCQNCYARRMAKRLAANPKVKPETRAIYQKAQAWDGTIRYRGQEWFDRELSKIPAGSRVFVNSMSDTFHENAKPQWIQELFDVMKRYPHLQFILGTKRPENIKLKGEFYFGGGDYLSNVLIFVTAENQARADERIPILIDSWPGQKGISCEPLLGPIDLRPYLKDLDWVIVGGETGAGWRYCDEEAEVTADWLNAFIKKYGPIPADKMMQTIGPELWLDWARSIRDQCHDTGVPFFGKKAPVGRVLPSGLRIREWPQRRTE